MWIFAPDILYPLPNWISMNLPKRDELSLRIVRALPNASSNGFDASTCSATLLVSPALLTAAR